MGCIIIDDKIIKDNDLNSTDKIVYGIIKSLTNNIGYCYATNNYIGKKSNLSKSTISNTISKLKQKNYITIETVDYQRKIFIKNEL